MNTENSKNDINGNYRVVVLLNKSLEIGKVLNAACHLGVAIANLIGENGREKLNYLDFLDSDGGVHPSISARSLIVLRGKAGELRKLRRQAIEADLLVADFTDTMTGETYVEQLKNTASTNESDLEYFGVIVCGEKEKLAPLTKRYSLWR